MSPSASFCLNRLASLAPCCRGGLCIKFQAVVDPPPYAGGLVVDEHAAKANGDTISPCDQDQTSADSVVAMIAPLGGEHRTADDSKCLTGRVNRRSLR